MIVGAKPGLLGGAAVPYVAAGTSFNGSSQYAQRSGSIIGSNSTQGIISFWLKRSGTGTTQRVIQSIDNGGIYYGTNIYISSADTFIFAFSDGSTTYNANVDYSTTGAWAHFMASWITSGSRVINGYLNGSNAGWTTSGGGSNFTWTTNGTTWDIAWNSGNSGFKLNGSLSELYFAPGQYLDLTVQSNREKFRSADGKPVSLGADGSTPTGTAPAVYLPNSGSSFGTNAGSGGNFTLTGSPPSVTGPP